MMLKVLLNSLIFYKQHRGYVYTLAGGNFIEIRTIYKGCILNVVRITILVILFVIIVNNNDIDCHIFDCIPLHPSGSNSASSIFLSFGHPDLAIMIMLNGSFTFINVHNELYCSDVNSIVQ